MTFGQRVAIIRKKKDIKQTELGSMIGTSGDIVSRYERDVISPTIEVAARIASALNVSLDHLVMGHEASTANTTDAVAYKFQQLEKLAEEDKGHVMAVIDAFITKQRVSALMGE
ncbi:helix-turn-helix domain-containing protein [Chitinophaga barathri]|nr:helix-turn-helix transcriptional regulator [Chitinophaga barathri]